MHMLAYKYYIYYQLFLDTKLLKFYSQKNKQHKFYITIVGHLNIPFWDWTLASRPWSATMYPIYLTFSLTQPLVFLYILWALYTF
jgi:hypothetical protein